jgi:hypothetical protein
MTDEAPLRHKTYTIRLMSYRRDGQWVPCHCGGTWRPGERQPSDTRARRTVADAGGADAIATKLAIEWIDSQFPSMSA